MDDKIYYRNFAQGTRNYRLELIPAKCDDNGDSVAFPSTPEEVALPENMIGADITLTSEYADRNALPLGLCQKDDLSIKVRIRKNYTEHAGFFDLICKPLIYQNTVYPNVFGYQPSYVQNHSVTILSLSSFEVELGGTWFGVDTRTYTIESTSPAITLNVTTETIEHQPDFREIVKHFAVASTSAASAFCVHVTRDYEDMGTPVTEYENYSFVYGDVPGYESTDVTRTARYGNIWRVWLMNGSTKQELLFEGMQRRVPAPDIQESSVDYTADILAVDVVRCALENTSVAELRSNLGTWSRIVSNAYTVPSVRSATASVFYQLKPTFSIYVFHTIQALYNSFGAAASKLSAMRRASATFSIEAPTHIKGYRFEDSHSTLTPSTGIELKDILFCSSINDNYSSLPSALGDARGGVFALKQFGDEQCWENQYNNAFDLLTDLAGNFMCKHVVNYSASGISIETLAPYGAIDAQAVHRIANTDWIGERTLTPGGAVIRGTSGEVEQPHDDDVTGVDYLIESSERDEELSIKFLLHNSPTYNIERAPFYLVAQGDTPGTGGNGGGTVKALVEDVRIDAGRGITFKVQGRRNWLGSTLSRDQIIAECQAENGLVNNVCKALTEMFSSNALTTIKGKLKTTAEVNSARVGALHKIQHPWGEDHMVLVRCADTLDESEVTYIGVISNG